MRWGLISAWILAVYLRLTNGLIPERDSHAEKSTTCKTVSRRALCQTPTPGCKYSRLRFNDGCVVAFDGHLVCGRSEDHEPSESNDHGASIVAVYVIAKR